MPCSPGMRACRVDCLHRAMVLGYHDARDAREAARESEPFLQHEPEDFAEAYPPVTFKDWLSSWWSHVTVLREAS